MEVKIHVKGILVFMYVTYQVKFWSMPLFTGFVTRLTLPVQLVEQALPTLLKHLSTNTVFSGFRVIWSLVLYICFVDRYLSSCPLSFGHCVICSSVILITHCYLQTLCTWARKEHSFCSHSIVIFCFMSWVE